MNLNQQSDEHLEDDADGGAADHGPMSGLAGMDDAGGAIDEDGIVTDERKPINRSSLVLGAIILASIGGLWVMHQRTGPRSALAATEETAKANETITQFLSNGDKNVKMMDQMLKDTEKFVSAFLKYPSASQVPLSDLQTNPFRHQPPASEEDGNARSVAEAQKKREEERLAVLKAVQDLQLQSVMHSDANKACMINNALYQEGQQVESFTIEKINPKGVIVKNGAYRFELRMQR